ncbi:MAG: hypothetical protein ACYDC6_15795 [Acidobacteriaceae bacterium]
MSRFESAFPDGYGLYEPELKFAVLSQNDVPRTVLLVVIVDALSISQYDA